LKTVTVPIALEIPTSQRSHDGLQFRSSRFMAEILAVKVVEGNRGIACFKRWSALAR
jgi:hypothetical protein